MRACVRPALTGIWAAQTSVHHVVALLWAGLTDPPPGGLGPQPWPHSHHYPCPSHSIQDPFVCLENSYLCSETQTKSPLCRDVFSVFSPATCASLPSQGSTVPPSYSLLGCALIPINMTSSKPGSPPPRTLGSEKSLISPASLAPRTMPWKVPDAQWLC